VSSFEKETTFARVIEEHLDLKRRNSELDGNMPLERYRVADPFENHPLFKTEEQARLEDTLSGRESEWELERSKVLAWPVEETEEEAAAVDPEDSLWGRSRDFDWGD
jgi:hypothetical protein